MSKKRTFRMAQAREQRKRATRPESNGRCGYFRGHSRTGEGLEEVLEKAANNGRVLLARRELGLGYSDAQLELLEADEDVCKKKRGRRGAQRWGEQGKIEVSGVVNECARHGFIDQPPHAGNVPALGAASSLPLIGECRRQAACRCGPERPAPPMQLSNLAARWRRRRSGREFGRLTFGGQEREGEVLRLLLALRRGRPAVSVGRGGVPVRHGGVPCDGCVGAWVGG
jgi:hypothetical protein